MAYRDELTGLPGRRALMQALDGAKGTYTIAMVDVDHFKRFNDRHGHDVGDQVLKLVASRLARAPGGAKAYRYGGEEFTLVLPGRVREDAAPHLEAVRESIAAARFSIRSWKRPAKKPGPDGKKKAAGKKGGTKAGSAKQARHLSVTVSIGMADTTVARGGPEDVLKKADQALYRAKKKGRNRVSK
jgi:GGDEF domain-containing protein